MSFVRFALAASLLALAGCQGTFDDLAPSSADKRPGVEPGSVGHRVGQSAPAFMVSNTLNESVTLVDELAGARAVVLYFNMWCPICDSHLSHLRATVVPDFPHVKVLVVDYVTGSVTASRSSQVANGYNDFTVLADTNQAVLNSYGATMATTVVIDAGGVVRMNEDYKDGVKLRQVLEALP